MEGEGFGWKNAELGSECINEASLERRFEGLWCFCMLVICSVVICGMY